MNPPFQTSTEDLLQQQLACLEHDRCFTTLSVLKENERERTEEVVDEAGQAFIRKYLHGDDDGFGSQYRSIQAANAPELPHIYEVYQIPGSTVVIMEKIEGVTLRSYVATNGPLPHDQARLFLSGVCNAIGILHSFTPPIIHRDITPDNIMVTAHGPVPIDFGIARRFDENATRDTHNWGTLGYAAPEQFGFSQSDERTDIYALGMLYWFALTGSDPQPGLSKGMRNQPIPVQAQDIIANCIALDPEKRYADTAALSCALTGEVSTYVQPPSSVQQANLELKVKTSQFNNTTNESVASSEKTQTTTYLSKLYEWASENEIFKTLFTAWKYAATIALILFSLILIASGPFSWRAAYPRDTVIYLVYVICVIVFLFLPIYLVTTNFKGVITRNPLLKNHRLLKLIAVAIICFLALGAASLLVLQLLSPEYLQEEARLGTAI